MKIFAKGLLSLFILREAEKPVSGKSIIEHISLLTNGKWEPSPGAIYPLLRQMEKDGLLTARLSDKEGRREITYRITEKGKRWLSETRARLERRQDFGLVFMPLIMRIQHNFTDEELLEISKQVEKFATFREKFMLLPEKKRREAFAKICDYCDKLLRDFHVYD